jgi:hypothetical protein
MVKNEKWFLPIWLNYYSKFFEERDIYVINHASTDDSIQLVKEQYKKINIVNLTYEPFDDIFKVNEIKKLQTALLGQYKCTLYSDPDELVMPYSAEGGLDLSDYIDNFIKSEDVAIKTNGWEVIQLPKKSELAIDLTKPILSQRSYWFHSPQWYSKVLLSKTPLNWSPGLHLASNIFKFDPALYLVHLHRIDYDLSYIKNITNNRFKRPPGMDLGSHVFITNPKEFHTHFWGMEDSDIIEKIPNNLKITNLF